jgi:1-acylglycerone phosphate reductase
MQEVEPFGVKVCEVVTGYVQSNILRDGLQCSSDSLYSPIKGHIETMKNTGNRNGMPAAVYARRVLDQVTRENPPREFWDGAQSWLLYFLVTWLPTWISVSRSLLDEVRNDRVLMKCNSTRSFTLNSS